MNCTYQKEGGNTMMSSVFRKGLRLLALPLLAVMLSLTFMLTGSMLRPATVHAQDTGGTITIAETAQLINRTTVRVTVTATAPSFPDAITYPYAQGYVRVDQVVSHRIVSVSVGFIPILDDVEHTYQIYVTPPPGSLPFHSGAATASAYFSIQYYDSFGNSHSIYGDSGTVAIRITR